MEASKNSGASVYPHPALSTCLDAVFSYLGEQAESLGLYMTAGNRCAVQNGFMVGEVYMSLQTDTLMQKDRL